MNEEIIYIDSENLERIVELLTVQIKEENNLIINYKETISEIIDNYDSNNIGPLEDLEMKNISNMKKVNSNHESNIFLIQKRIENVKRKVQKVKNIEENSKVNGVVDNE